MTISDIYRKYTKAHDLVVDLSAVLADLTGESTSAHEMLDSYGKHSALFREQFDPDALGSHKVYTVVGKYPQRTVKLVDKIHHLSRDFYDEFDVELEDGTRAEVRDLYHYDGNKHVVYMHQMYIDAQHDKYAEALGDLHDAITTMTTTGSLKDCVGKRFFYTDTDEKIILAKGDEITGYSDGDNTLLKATTIDGDMVYLDDKYTVHIVNENKGLTRSPLDVLG